MSGPAALPDFLNDLGKRVRGDLRTDAYSQIFYSTDASIYSVKPHGVLIPRDPDDVQAAVEAGARYGIPILARGAGSSLAGQAVNTALVVDVSRHLDGVLEFNPEERWVRVGPGIVLDELNAFLAQAGLQFGPDPASSNRATLGGIVSNNSTGSHSILYGMTADHVLETRVILSDGSRAHFKALSEPELAQRLAAPDLEGRIYRELQTLTAAGAGTIRAGTPRHWRRCGGYNLDRLIPALPGENGGTVPSFWLSAPGGFNLAGLVCGAEGTLAVIEEIKLNLVPVHRKTALGILHFAGLYEALASVPGILETGPSAVELLDHLGLSRSREVPEYARLIETFVQGDPHCILITEYAGDTEVELHDGLARLARLKLGEGTVELRTPESQARVWQLRKVALGFMMSVRGDFKPIPFIEDAAVPVEHLADYITQIEEFCGGLGTRIGYYAHASAGCLHVRPLVNTKSAEEIAKMPEILSFSAALLGEYGGALSSEHGDGRARSWINERFFGRELYGLYRQTKAVFDPANLFNPGNIVDSPAMTENLRYGPEYRTVPLREHLDFSADLGFAGAVEMCNGAGICRKMTRGTMCPSFMVTREEEHSTRGRANALRAALSGALPVEALTSQRMYEVMDLCIECKACKSECPSGVDMARIKFEFLAHYHEKKPPSLRSRLFAGVPSASRMASGPLAPVANAMLGFGPFKRVLERLTGITSRRDLPKFARRPFSRRSRGADRPDARRVVLFADTVNNYNHPETLAAAHGLLEAAGFDVWVQAGGCCGRPYISKGLYEKAVQAARSTVGDLLPHIAAGIPVVVLEPSCLSAIKDDYLFLLGGEGPVRTVADGIRMFDEFLVELVDRGELGIEFEQDDREVLLHGHCHQKALFGTAATRRMLALTGARVAEVDSGCCGMAGSFGYEAEHYEISQKMGERRLFPAVRAHTGDTAAPGVSCRAQIEHGTGVSAFHPVEILYQRLRK
ncbi:MAG TPA: FAD-linked oxidase C-terminal domain-containing protein [Anaerolineales bacterium]|nr:FAD-linked oxidase C-terminal domain-containing protein [Anaerolineales bacterium]